MKDNINAEGTVLSAYVAVVENTSTGQNADGLAIKLGTTQNPEVDDNFIGFFDGDGIIGSIEGNGAGDIVLGTDGNDFAEYLPRLDIHEVIQAGDIVGVYEDGVSLKTDRVVSAMVVSTAPAVLGNKPQGDIGLDTMEPIAFIGQVPVKIQGPVSFGDLIVPSGRNDGTGIAISPENFRTDYRGPIVGQAWETDQSSSVKQVMIVVGLDGSTGLRILLRQQQLEIELLREQIKGIIAALGTE